MGHGMFARRAARSRMGVLLATAAAVLLAAPGAAHAADCSGWMDPVKTPEARAQALIAAMPLDQKLKLLTYSNPPWFTYYGTAGHIDANPAYCIPTLVLSDAGSGVAGFQYGTTTFPSGVAQSASWDRDLQRQVGHAIGWEAWRKGINVMLGPGMNIARVPMNGRNFEYFGEDPFLAGETAVSVIRGIQSNPVLATAKHYAMNNQEIERNSIDVVVDERTAHEIYLPAFEASVKRGHVGSIMCSYNKVGGKWVCENPHLLTDYLRRDFGWDGFVMSDWAATHSTVEAANAGLDMEMNVAGTQYFAQPLADAVAAGKVPPARIDEMVRRIVTPMFRFGLFDHPPIAHPQAYLTDVATPEHLALARKMAESSAVLLKNDRHALPLEGSGRRIAVIGYAANPVGAANNSGGGGSSRGSGIPPRYVSPLEGILRQAQAHNDIVTYAEGDTPADAQAAAAAADVAIVVAADSESEGGDRPSLGMRPGICVTLLCGNLPLDQDAMIEAAAAGNPNTIVAIDSGGPVKMPWLDKVRAVVFAWYAGLENGNALASILYGETNPSGKLPQSFPKAESDLPIRNAGQYPGVDGQETYSEGMGVGYRWFDQQGIAPLFPFGFGLSYTTFRLSGLRVTPSRTGAKVSFTVTNTGDREGAEVGQVYLAFPAKAGEPPKQLKGFQKVNLAPGESKTVDVSLGRRAFAWFDVKAGTWRVSPGCYRVLAGTSSRDLPLQRDVAIGSGRCGNATALGRGLLGLIPIGA